MDATGIALQPVLVLLASSVLAVVACRSLSLPPIVGYLVTGLVLGPHALGLIEDSDETRRLAEFGVVFLMFSIGLEFSLPRLLHLVAGTIAGRIEQRGRALLDPPKD